MPDSITRRRFTALAGGTAITAALPIGYARAAEHTFKIGTNVPASHPFRDKLSEAGYYREWRGKFGEDAWSLLEETGGKLA
jgi:hypothetical protein